MTFLRKSHLLATISILAIACDGGDGGGTDDTDTSDTTDTTCDSTLESFFPENGAEGVFYKTSIEIAFGQAEDSSTATITLAAGGTDVPGTVTFSDDGETAYFTPTADLSPSTEYTLTASYSCDKTATATWTTGEAGPAVDANTLVNNVYNIDLFSGRVYDPPGVGDIITQLLGQAGEPIYVLVSPTEVNGTSITMRGALGATSGADIVQDMCSESINFPVAADYSANPFFTITGENVPLSVQGISLSIDSLDVSGAFTPDGSAITGVKVAAFIDTRPLESLIPDLCSVVGIAGISCIACDDGVAACLRLGIDSLEAAQVGTQGIMEMSTDDVAANPDCATE